MGLSCLSMGFMLILPVYNAESKKTRFTHNIHVAVVYKVYKVYSCNVKLIDCSIGMNNNHYDMLIPKYNQQIQLEKPKYLNEA